MALLACLALACGESEPPDAPPTAPGLTSEGARSAESSSARAGGVDQGAYSSGLPDGQDDPGDLDDSDFGGADQSDLAGSELAEERPLRKPARAAPPGVLEAEAELVWVGGDKGTALTLLSRAVADRPESAAPRSEFGRRLLSVTAFDLAQEHLEKAAELSPDDPQVQLDLVTLYENTGDADRAAEARARAEALAPDRTIIQDDLGFYTFE